MFGTYLLIPASISIDPGSSDGLSAPSGSRSLPLTWAGVRIAANVADLHGDVERDRNYLFGDTALDENGNAIPGRGSQPQNKHDILTGSDSRGMAMTTPGDHTCNNWTSGGEGSAQLGHHDRSGGNTTSWNSAHGSRGCDLESLNGSGGAGKFYCFAAN